MPSERIAYVLKVYPRFSETFVVTEILAREAAGEDLAIYALRPTTDSRFHPQLAQVQAPVTHLPRAHKLSAEWEVFARAQAELPDFGARLGELMPLLVRLDPSDVAQGVDLALRLRRDGITRVHVHFANMASWCTTIASALTGIPFTVTTHAKDLFHDDVDRVVLREVLRRASTVVTISDYNRRFLVEQVDPALEPKVALVRNGLELCRFTYRDPAPVGDTLRVLAVGRVVEKKGFDHLVQAAALLRDEGTRLQVRIVGEGELADDLAAQVRRSGLDDVVTLLGSRSQAELVTELDWADVMVAPCVVGADGNADGLPTVLLEAMASGVPCIATDVTGIPEAIQPATHEQTGLLLSHERDGLATRVADALRQVAEPGWPRADVARRARALVERDFDTTTQAAHLAAVTAGADR
ncbi:glycosyltransferase [Serinicoccus kebangsaanensis]|uniref:glycosyltransferase n=1 Tax=Serinicoccus kebangsaanensis TaxID=2602069 RepID=UPI00124C160F|nr:glycosyltransferase [Serinicoccus kebangsaanensis]